MEQVKIFEYYSFGYNYRLILNERKDSTNKECYEDLEKHIDFIKKLDLRVYLSSIEMLGIDLDISKLKKITETPGKAEQKVDKLFWTRLIEKLYKVDNTLDAELNIKIGYLLDEKRASHEILLTKMFKLFSKGVFVKLPPIAQFDFEESGKCLAFDRYTACAFHSLRGTEDVLKMYYEKVLKLTSTDKDTWGTFETAIVAAISNSTIKPAPDEQLILNISSLRKYYRNKTQHPQNTYSSDESQDLLSLCIKTVNELIADLEKRKLI